MKRDTVHIITNKGAEHIVRLTSNTVTAVPYYDMYDEKEVWEGYVVDSTTLNVGKPISFTQYFSYDENIINEKRTSIGDLNYINVVCKDEFPNKFQKLLKKLRKVK